MTGSDGVIYHFLSLFYGWLLWIIFLFMQSLQSMGNLLGCVQVDQSTVAITEQFGKYQDVLQPGCHCLPWCFGFQLAGHLSLRVQQLDVRCETKTKVYSLFRNSNSIVLTQAVLVRSQIIKVNHNLHFNKHN